MFLTRLVVSNKLAKGLGWLWLTGDIVAKQPLDPGLSLAPSRTLSATFKKKTRGYSRFDQAYNFKEYLTGGVKFDCKSIKKWCS